MRNKNLVQNKLISKIKLKTPQKMSLKNMKEMQKRDGQQISKLKIKYALPVFCSVD